MRVSTIVFLVLSLINLLVLVLLHYVIGRMEMHPTYNSVDDYDFFWKMLAFLVLGGAELWLGVVLLSRLIKKFS